MQTFVVFLSFFFTRTHAAPSYYSGVNDRQNRCALMSHSSSRRHWIASHFHLFADVSPMVCYSAMWHDFSLAACQARSERHLVDAFCLDHPGFVEIHNTTALYRLQYQSWWKRTLRSSAEPWDWVGYARTSLSKNFTPVLVTSDCKLSFSSAKSLEPFTGYHAGFLTALTTLYRWVGDALVTNDG